MALQHGNPFGRQVNVRRNLDQILAPGVQANRTSRFSQNIGVVKEETRRIRSNYYIANVDVNTQFGRLTVTVQDVRFNVPVAEGDVVSLEIIGGDPRNGVFGTPIRAHGPVEISFDAAGPFTLPMGAALEPMPVIALPEEQRILVQTVPFVAYVELTAKLFATVTVSGGENPGTYQARVPEGRLSVFAQNVEFEDADGNTVAGGTINSRVTTHYGLEAAGANNSEMKATGNHLLFARTIIEHPAAVGALFDVRIDAMPVELDGFEYYHPVTHPQYEHPEFVHDSHPSLGTTPSHPSHAGGTHDMWDHVEVVWWLWESAGMAPRPGESYTATYSISDIRLDIVELGTGGG